MPQISIIVPVYNTEKYLRECVESVLAWENKNYELILINDGSNDASGGIIDEYAKKHTNITAVHKDNGGISSARNAGLKIATGEYILFLDADDVVDDVFFEALAKIKDKAPDVICLGLKKFSGEFKSVFKPQKNYLATELCGDEVKGLAGDVLYVAQNISRGKRDNIRVNEVCGHLIKKSFLDENNLLFTEEVKFAEDTLFLFNMFLRAKSVISFSFLCGYYYRQINGSIMHKYSPNFFARVEPLINEINNAYDFSKDAKMQALQSCLFVRLALRSLNLEYLNKQNNLPVGANKESFYKNVNAFFPSGFLNSVSRGWFEPKEKPVYSGLKHKRFTLMRYDMAIYAFYLKYRKKAIKLIKKLLNRG